MLVLWAVVVVVVFEVDADERVCREPPLLADLEPAPAVGKGPAFDAATELCPALGGAFGLCVPRARASSRFAAVTSLSLLCEASATLTLSSLALCDPSSTSCNPDPDGEALLDAFETSLSVSESPVAPSQRRNGVGCCHEGHSTRMTRRTPQVAPRIQPATENETKTHLAGHPHYGQRGRRHACARSLTNDITTE